MTSIEQRMNINAHSKAVGYCILAIIFERLYMCCFQYFWYCYISNDASLTSLKNSFAEVCLIWSVNTGAYTLSFNFGGNITCSYLIKCFEEGFVFWCCMNQLINLGQDLHVYVVLFGGIPACAFSLYRIAIVF